MAAPTSDVNGNGRAVVVALGGRRTSGEKLDVVESTLVSNGVSFQAESSFERHDESNDESICIGV